MENEITKFATVSWTPEDIVDHTDGKFSEKQAIEFLERNEKYIQSDMIERGWDSIGTLISFEENEGTI